MNENKNSDFVTKVVIFLGNKILFLMPDYSPFKGSLDLPGGHVHTKEELVDGLRREVKEETGLELTNHKKLFEKDNITYYYSTINKAKAKKITLSHEHSEYKLMTLEKVVKEDHKINPDFLAAVRKAQKLRDDDEEDIFGDLIKTSILFATLLMLVKGLYN